MLERASNADPNSKLGVKSHLSLNKKASLYFGLAILAWCLLLTAMLLNSVLRQSFDEEFYEKQYRQLQIANSMGLSQEELARQTAHLLRYTKGEVEALDLAVQLLDGRQVPMFNARERAHMVDVRHLALTANRLQLWLWRLGLIVLLGLILRQKSARARLLFWSYALALLLFGLFVAGVFFWVSVDFEQFWVFFHERLFRNDLWLLDPRTDRLIQMVPSPFFSALILAILKSFLLKLVALLLSLGLAWQWEKTRIRKG